MWYYASCFTTWVFPKNGGTPKSSVLIGFSIINHPFWGTPIFGNTHLVIWMAFVCRQVVVLLAEKNVSRSEVQRFDFWSCQRPSFWVYKYVPNHWVQGKKNTFVFCPSSQSSKLRMSLLLRDHVHKNPWALMDNQAYRRPLRMVNDCESTEKNGTNEKSSPTYQLYQCFLVRLVQDWGPEPPVGWCQVWSPKRVGPQGMGRI